VGRYVVRRLLQLIPVFLGATILIYALVFAMPGDPIRALAGERPISATVIETIRDRYNLNDPFLVQYGKYLANIFQGDFGTDFRGRPVTEYFATRIPVTVRLALLAFAFEAVLGLIAGILAGIRRGNFMDNLVLVLKGVGLDLSHVVQARVYLTQFKEDYARMNSTYASYFPADRRPARTCVGVTALARDSVVEIDLVAKR